MGWGKGVDPGSWASRRLELSLEGSGRLCSSTCPLACAPLSLPAYVLLLVPVPDRRPRCAEHAARNPACTSAARLALFAPFRTPHFDQCYRSAHCLRFSLRTRTFLLLCFLFLHLPLLSHFESCIWPPLRDSPSHPGRAPTLLPGPCPLLLPFLPATLPLLSQTILICDALPHHSRTNAWTGARASPTYSPAPANARLPNGNQQGPPGAFPPLANANANGARPPAPNAEHTRILAQISGLTVRSVSLPAVVVHVH